MTVLGRSYPRSLPLNIELLKITTTLCTGLFSPLQVHHLPRLSVLITHSPIPTITLPATAVRDKESGFVMIMVSHCMFPDILLAICCNNLPCILYRRCIFIHRVSFTVAVEMPKGIDFKGWWPHCRCLSTPMSEPQQPTLMVSAHHRHLRGISP